MIKPTVVNNALTGYLERRTSDVKKIQKDTADFVVERQTELCPRSDNNEPGHVHIADTIHVEQDGDVHRVVEGDDDHIYGPFLEHGTDKMAAQPHQRPAAIEGKRYQEEQYAGLR